MDDLKNIKIEQIEKRLNIINNEKEELLQEAAKAAKTENAFLSSYEIRPSGRHLLTIGKELIQDQIAAIIELVKNCYDADSLDATICFRQIPHKDYMEICIEDNGHGMSTEDIINKWLVPSTTHKRERKSPAGRTMQGHKGIGRYAASILGNNLIMETIDTAGQKTTVYIDWDSLSKYQYLDQIKIPIHREITTQPSGTKITIHSELEKNMYWKDETFSKLRFELKKLISPKSDNIFNDSFRIWLQFENFFSNSLNKNGKEEIFPYPILELYDYRISGTVNADGKGTLTYENQKIRNGAVECFDIDYGPTDCGTLIIDVRVYDRDKEAIDQLIGRGKKNGSFDQSISKSEARNLLDKVNGIGVYLNGFRIRPLGDADFDWLRLNEQRVQNPSMRIGSNQVAGYVHIESEELSGLEEKSARDGLKSNHAYDKLKYITKEVISKLEERRFVFRRKTGLSNPAKKIEGQLEGLYDYTELKKSISDSLKKAEVSQEIIEDISNIIFQEESRKNDAIEEIRRAVAIYQGQATLGKIINIILHEGRQPLNYLKNQIPNLHFYAERFLKNNDKDSVREIVRLTTGVADNVSIFSSLFSRLDPLAARRRETKSTFSLRDTLKSVISVFESTCNEEDIKVEIQCPDNLKFTGWHQDIHAIFTNLIDNSIFWIVEKKSPKRSILINVVVHNSELIIDYTDSGPGISDELLSSGVIFEPQFTTKPKGTGLGLSIAGEAASRNNLILTAVQNENGAHFKLCTDSEVSDV